MSMLVWGVTFACAVVVVVVSLNDVSQLNSFVRSFVGRCQVVSEASSSSAKPNP